MGSRKVTVAASAVRTWASSPEGVDFLATWAKDNEVDVPTVGKRGKFSEPLLTAFHKANPKSRYEAKYVAPREIKGTRVHPESGRKTPVTVRATLTEVRTWALSQPDLGVGKRGRIAAPVFAAFAARPKVDA